MTPRSRPLSPHVLNYRFPFIVMLSGIHRITGVLLAIGTLLLAYWLGSAAYGPAAYDQASHFLASPLGYLVLFGFTLCLFYHLANGVRHLLWDIGWGYELADAQRSGTVVVVVAVVLTIITWAVGLSI